MRFWRIVGRLGRMSHLMDDCADALKPQFEQRVLVFVCCPAVEVAAIDDEKSCVTTSAKIKN